MADFQINDADLAGFKGKVAIITGTTWCYIYVRYCKLTLP